MTRDERDLRVADRADRHRVARRAERRCDLHAVGGVEEAVEARAAEHADVGGRGHGPQAVLPAGFFVSDEPEPDDLLSPVPEPEPPDSELFDSLDLADESPFEPESFFSGRW